MTTESADTTEVTRRDASALQRGVRRCKRSPTCKRLRRYNRLTERTIKRKSKPARLLGRGGAWARLARQRIRQQLRASRRTRRWKPKHLWRKEATPHFLAGAKITVVEWPKL